MDEEYTPKSTGGNLKQSVEVVIVDDEPEISKALKSLFEVSGEIQVVAIGYSANDAAKLVRENKPDVILLDLHFPDGSDGIEAIRQIGLLQDNRCRILVYTISRGEKTIFDALKAGAFSYVWKDEPHAKLKEAVLATARGEAYISPAVARLVLEFFNDLRRKGVRNLE